MMHGKRRQVRKVQKSEDDVDEDDGTYVADILLRLQGLLDLSSLGKHLRVGGLVLLGLAASLVVVLPT